MGVGLPKGPMTLRILSLSPSEERSAVDFPTTWKTIVIVPFAASESAIVRGMRSPVSSAMRMMNWPGLCLEAICASSISNLKIPRPISSFARISFFIRQTPGDIMPYCAIILTLVGFILQLIVSSRVITCWTHIRRRFPFMHITTFTTDPYNLFFFLKYRFCFYFF